MKFLIFLCLLHPLFLQADWEQFSSEDQDPALFHHVNVITGNLNIMLQDAQVHGAMNLPLTRTYTSAGALERDRSNFDIRLSYLRGGWMIQGGWSLFPHADLMLTLSSTTVKDVKAYLPEKSGSLVAYKFSHKKKHHTYFIPDLKDDEGINTGGARSNVARNLLRLNYKKGVFIHYLPDGSKREYWAVYTRLYDPINNPTQPLFFRLVHETLPSQHHIEYIYDKDRNLVQVEIKNPAKTKNLAWLHLDLDRLKAPYRFSARTSDGKKLQYRGMEFQGRDYISEVNSTTGRHEAISYEPGRKGIGARVNRFTFNNRTQFKVHYYLPHDKKQENDWYKHPENKTFEADKVLSLEAPFGDGSASLPVAQFTYQDKLTEVRDVCNLLTRYHYDAGKLNHIEYYNEQQSLSTQIRFIYEGRNLISKVLLDSQGDPLFSKTFRYDQAGNVIEEHFWGNLSGQANGPFTMDEQGRLAGAESFRKSYQYEPQLNVPLVEEEEGGVTYRYAYLPGTDLPTAKFTCDGDNILIREFTQYNADHLPIVEIRDDGRGLNPDDLSGVRERHIKRYELDPENGMTLSASEFYYDTDLHAEKLLSTIKYTYSAQNQITAEAVYDANGS